MSRVDWRERVIIDPDVHHGNPCIKGTRIPVSVIVGSTGHAADTVTDEGMGGAKDPALWDAVQVAGRFLVTADKGFAGVRVDPPGTHNGVLLLRPDDDGIGPLVDLLRRVLRDGPLDPLRGTVAVATPRGLRVRRGP